MGTSGAKPRRFEIPIQYERAGNGSQEVLVWEYMASVCKVRNSYFFFPFVAPSFGKRTSLCSCS